MIADEPITTANVIAFSKSDVPEGTDEPEPATAETPEPADWRPFGAEW